LAQGSGVSGEARSLFLMFALYLAVGALGAVELTKADFESSIAGKNAFVKFLAPW